MAIPSWLTATWGDIFAGNVGVVDPDTGEIVSGETARRVFEAKASKAVCEGLTREELNALVRRMKSFPLAGDELWWMHEYDAAEFEGLRQLGGCPSESYTPATVTETQIALALEQERARSQRWLIGVGAVTAAIVGLAAWALWPRRRGRKGRRR